MSLDSLFSRKKSAPEKQDAQYMQDDGEYHSRAEEETQAARAPSKRVNARKNNSTSPDPALPEKKRARRRLIGAVAMVLAAVIGLPMVFDSEPKSANHKINLDIPSKDSPSTSDATASMNAELSNKSARPALPPALPVPDASIDATEEFISASAVSSGASVATTNVATPTKVTPPVTKTEIKKENKENKEVKDVKTSKDEAARALALLEGKAPSDTSTKVDAPNAHSFTVQVAALSSAAKIVELQNKLRAASIKFSIQKIVTTNGEVSRIRVGPFATKAEAEKMRVKLEKLGLGGKIIPS